MIRHVTWLKAITLIILVLLAAAALMAQPAEISWAGFTPEPPKPTPGGGGGGGGGGDGGPPKESKMAADPPPLLLPTATPGAPEVVQLPTLVSAAPAVLPISGGGLDVANGLPGWAARPMQKVEAALDWMLRRTHLGIGYPILSRKLARVVGISAARWVCTGVVSSGAGCLACPLVASTADTSPGIATMPDAFVKSSVDDESLPTATPSAVPSPVPAPEQPGESRIPQASSGTSGETRDQAESIELPSTTAVEFPRTDPAWKLLFADDFSSEFLTWLYNSPDSADLSDPGDVLSLAVGATETVSWAVPRQSFEGNIVVQMDVRGTDTLDSYSTGLLMRFQDVNNFYELEIRSEGSFVVWEMVDGESKALLGPIQSPLIRTGGGPNRVSAIAYGAMMVFGVNGYQLGTVVADALPDGDIGFVLHSDGGNRITAAFDNVEVRQMGIEAPSQISRGSPLSVSQTTTDRSARPSSSSSPLAQPTLPPKPVQASLITTPTPTPTPVRVIPQEWIPPANQASLVVVNESGGDIVFSMGDQQRRIPPHGESVIFREAGTHGYTASDPRFEPYHGQCDLAAGAVYYWYTDDSMVSDRCALVEW